MKHFTFYTIIGRDPEMFEAHVRNVKEHAGFDRIQCDKQFIAVVYMNERIPAVATSTIMRLCFKYDIQPIYYMEPQGDPWLKNLYRCWNLGYEYAKPGHVFRSGSDQMWNRDGILAMQQAVERAPADSVLWSNTVESGRRAPHTRHITAEYGNHPREFDAAAFDAFCASLNHGASEFVTLEESISRWGRPLTFHSPYYGQGHNRLEGTSWLMTTDEFNQYGPMPEGLVNGFTGDVILADTLERSGKRHLIVRDSVTFHYVRGESAP